ncbi:MAG: hypothetical protein COB14_00190 [Alphaproteobacteria bacterium]|nr:MAG: hypothetical protein COB14_00190 [Alphaproteobacteria bacterium]
MMDNDALYAEVEAFYKKAFDVLLKLAEAGDAESMCRIANMYAVGDGVGVDYDKSIYWDKKALELNEVSARNNLGCTYRMRGDIVSAKYWFEQAVEHGDIEAALALARLYMVSDKEADKVLEYLDLVINADPVSVCESLVEEAETLKKKLK